MVKLTEWVPALATELRVPAPLVHMKAQQTARQHGITWGAELTARDTATVRDGAREAITHAIKSTRK